MKCVHCSSVVERTDWFCPNCRRSLPHGPRRPLWVPILAGAAATGYVLAAGTFVGARLGRASVRVEEPVISVRDVPPDIAGRAGARVEPLRVARLPEPLSARVSPHSADLGPAFRDERREAPVTDPNARGAVSIETDPPVHTFVYLNGGSLLGETPVREAPIPAGRHTLIFWAPSVGGRATRTVDVEPGGSVSVVATIRRQDQFARALN